MFWLVVARRERAVANDLYVVAFDGSHTAVVDYAITCSLASGASLHIVHVLEWSPYAFLTPEEIEQRHAQRTKELARAEAEVLHPIMDHARNAGVTVSGEVRFGSAVSILCDIAKQKNAQQMFAGRTGDTPLKARVFGSVAIGLAQASPVPIVIVP